MLRSNLSKDMGSGFKKQMLATSSSAGWSGGMSSASATPGSKLGQDGNGSRTHRGVLQHDPIVDESNISGWMGCFGSPVCNQVQHPYRQHGVFTVFNEFTKMQQGAIYRFGKGPHQGHDTGNNGTLEFKTTFIPEKGGQKSNNPMMLGRVCQAKFLETLDNGNFVFVGNLMEKGGNLLQQAVDGILASRLEEGGNGEGGHEAIGIRRQNFQFGIAFTHHP
eukprot:scaffold8442_cov53-Attheya_sp.AAC.2